jgi:DNA-binding LytR/AlgR family response regulator
MKTALLPSQPSARPTCLIIYDEPVARKGLAEDLVSLGLVTVQGMAADTAVALEMFTATAVDLLFLDIEMPGVNGLDFLQQLADLNGGRKLPNPLVILVTAYPQYALNGYEHGVVDYLLKPVSIQRLRAACEKAVEWYGLRLGASRIGGGEEHLYLKYNGGYEKVAVADILYIEAANNYILVYTTAKKLLIYSSLKGIEEQLPAGDFLQVHKSFIIARRHIRRVNGDSIMVAQTRIPLSRRFKSRVLQLLHLTNNSRPVE